MTFIEPHQQYRTNAFFLIFIGLLIMLAVSGIYIYNQNVQLRHEVNFQQKHAATLQLVNADQKNQLYKILDAENVELVAQQKQLVKERNPRYLTLPLNSLASN